MDYFNNYKSNVDDISILINSINDEFQDYYEDDNYDIYF